MVVLNPGATANLVCSRWPARHNRILDWRGIPRVTTYPSKARSRFADGRLGEVRHAADIPVAIAGYRGMRTAFVLEADIPALLRKGAMEAIGGQLDFLHGSFNLRRRGAQIPPRVNRAGRCILSEVDFRRGPSRRASNCPEASASSLPLARKFPDLPDGGLHLPCAPDGLYRFGARDGCLTDPKKIVMKLHVSSGHAPA